MTNESPNSPSHRTDRAALVARRLAELRREHQLSQGALGAIAGTSQATVSRWEDASSHATPSALEVAAIAEHFEVDAGWLLGIHAHRSPLPPGETIIDQGLLDDFVRAEGDEQLQALLGKDLTFGTVWVEIPVGAEVVSTAEALRRVREVDRHVRQAHPSLWQKWAEMVLR